MSGLEVISGISAVIGILDAAAKIYDSVRDDLNLPETFTVVRRRLPIILDTLQICKDDLQPTQGSMSPDARDSFTQIVEVCQENAEKLKMIFEATIPGENDTWEIRYRKVLRSLGKGSRVEELMILITQDVELMVNNHAVRSAKPDQMMELANIIKELEDAKTSVIEDERTAFTFHSGGGAQTNSLNTGTGQQINNLGYVGTQNFNQSK
ncbi:uncharacterized protein LDX57_010083 [Aspergillus melleus]|uniref:uncharacterized protein n=1 Tax=Aspergillus melleus TaxID=138277 RepID=UPI001E8EADA2|nr:uncharacterized protein LDX57_010083 [Aspergillus melleus]KAH8432447.1 hypothetical protein LDX57_010083 [Aspergillus melleus]